MRKIIYILLLPVLTLTITGCNKVDEPKEDLDICEGLEDCFILDDSEVLNYTTIIPRESLDISNIDLQQISDIVTLYEFNYFVDNVTDLTNVERNRVLWAYNVLDNYLTPNRLGKMSLFVDQQVELSEFMIEELLENNVQYIEIEDEVHLLYKTDVDIIFYRIYRGGSMSEYEFDISRNQLSNIDYGKPSSIYISEINESEYVNLTATFFSYSYDNIVNSEVQEKESLYMNQYGGYSLNISADGNLTTLRTFLTYDSSYAIMHNVFTISYDEDSSLFVVYDTVEEVSVSIGYDALFFTVFSHPYLNTQTIEWYENEYSKETLIQLLNQ